MKNLMLGAAALLAFSGFALAGGECCKGGKAQASAKTPLIEKADGLLAKWKESAAKPASISESDMAAMAKAGEVLAANCPVCKHMPATMGFLNKTMSLANSLEKACQTKCAQSDMAAKMPAEIKSMMSERAALLDRSAQVLGATAAMMGKDSNAKSCCKDGGATESKSEAGCCKSASCETNTNCYASLEKKADELLAAWDGMPAAFNALQGETRANVMSAMETMKKINPDSCALFQQSVAVAGEMAARTVAIDAEMAKSCSAKKDDASCAAKTDEEKAMMKAMESRTAVLRKAAALLEKMAKVMNPENKTFTASVQ